MVPATDLATWTGEWYNEGPIEDVLNLGLNYIINIGENEKIGNTFTLRITPHVSTDQTPPSSYVEVTENDFNADGIADILWRNTDGRIVVWYMKKDTSHTSMLLSTESASWSIEQTADFNADGIADILWRNTDGRIVVWYMNKDGSRTSTLLSTESDKLEYRTDS